MSEVTEWSTDYVEGLLAENAALKRENERLKTYASTLLELALADVDLPLLTAEEQDERR